MCGVEITVENDRITSIRGDDDDPLSRGHVCPKAVALKDIHEDPDRLKVPMKRIGDRWEEIGWKQAFDEAGARLTEIRRTYGRHAIGLYQGNPTVHNHGSILYAQFFARALGTHNKFSATSLDQLPHMLAGLLMFGHQLLMPVPDVDRTKLFLIFGANPAVSNGSLMTAGDVVKRIRDVENRGGEVIVVDPRRTETAALASEHLAIHPGTDALLLAAMIRTILKERGARLGRLESFTEGLELIERNVEPFSPDRVAEPTRIPAERIRSLALRFADAEPAVAYGRIGVCTQEFGGLSAWLINVLNTITGNLDRAGGAMFTKPAIDAVKVASGMGLSGTYGRRKSRVRGLPEFGGELPAAVLAEEIETPGEGQIRALVTSAGNPVLSSPNGRRLDRALAGLDYMVAIDIYVNETTRHANLILPPTSALEHDHYDLAFHLLAVRNTAKYSPALFEKPEHMRHDWEIFLELTKRIQTPRKLLDRVTLPVRNRFLALGPRPILDLGLRTGPWRLSLSALEKNPHGVDLGPLEPCFPHRLQTKKKTIDLAPAPLLEDLERLERRTARATNGALSLIGRRELRSNNSWMHNSERLVKGKPRCTLRMHPQDASARGLSNGQQVRVKSRVGAVQVPLEVTDEMLPGVVSLPHGWGHDREGIRLGVAERNPGVSINDLTDDALLDELSGNVRFSDVPVEVTALG